jgi:nitrogen fixation/metabolism regulation signal transduction histidine kinase
VTIVALVTFAIAFSLSRVSAALAYAPLGHLIAATRLVRERNQYDVRAQKTTDDEIGELIDNFNQMLSEIDRRDRQLLLQQIDLEQVGGHADFGAALGQRRTGGGARFARWKPAARKASSSRT